MKLKLSGTTVRGILKLSPLFFGAFAYLLDFFDWSESTSIAFYTDCDFQVAKTSTKDFKINKKIRIKGQQRFQGLIWNSPQGFDLEFYDSDGFNYASIYGTNNYSSIQARLCGFNSGYAENGLTKDVQEGYSWSPFFPTADCYLRIRPQD